jgi:molybdopterin/thiamine biosynthesis adenylyltransferase/rhodanese-related sulfurtransferase
MNDFYKRYQRQIILPQLGESGQQKLCNASVLAIGVGGLGCPALQYLAAAGVGKIGIADDDIISLNNLHRQILFDTADVGLTKAHVAATKIKKLNPDIDISTYTERVTNITALSLISKYDVVLDCTDNFSSRYIINDACVLLQKPLVFGALSRSEGQLAVFNVVDESLKTAANYRDIFPEYTRNNEIQNCNETGIIGAWAGIIGTMMAGEAIKLITGIAEPLLNKMLVFNTVTYQQNIFNIMHRQPALEKAPKDEKEFMEFDYEMFCGSSPVNIINKEEFSELVKRGSSLLVDVREQGEMPVPDKVIFEQIPLSILENNFDKLNKDVIILFCQTGQRSKIAVETLKQKFGDSKKIYSLQNGVEDLMN